MEIKRIQQSFDSNEDCSNEIKNKLKDKNVYMVNVMGSPGTGKTSLVIEIIKKLKDIYNFAVIEGDIAGQVDAEKIDALGIPVVQLNTEGACHIEPASIKNAIEYFALDDIDVIFVENIGNLVCPAEFNIGEDLRIVILSIPEGDDKAEKYPLMFSTVDVLVLSKFDMVPYFEFDDKKVEDTTKSYNLNTKVFRTSAKAGDGLEELCAYIIEKVKAKLDN